MSTGKNLPDRKTAPPIARQPSRLCTEVVRDFQNRSKTSEYRKIQYAWAANLSSSNDPEPEYPDALPNLRSDRAFRRAIGNA